MIKVNCQFIDPLEATNNSPLISKFRAAFSPVACEEECSLGESEEKCM